MCNDLKKDLIDRLIEANCYFDSLKPNFNSEDYELNTITDEISDLIKFVCHFQEGSYDDMIFKIDDFLKFYDLFKTKVQVA